MQAGGRHDEVVVSHQRIQLSDGLGDLSARSIVALLRQHDLGDDALGGKMREEVLASLDPREMSAQPRHDPQAPLGDVAAKLEPEWLRPRRSHDVARGPGLTGGGVRVGRQRLPFSW
jgi:hypothetical protein